MPVIDGQATLPVPGNLVPGLYRTRAAIVDNGYYQATTLQDLVLSASSDAFGVSLYPRN